MVVISLSNDCNVVLAVRNSLNKTLAYSTVGEVNSKVEMKADILESVAVYIGTRGS